MKKLFIPWTLMLCSCSSTTTNVQVDDPTDETAPGIVDSEAVDEGSPADTGSGSNVAAEEAEVPAQAETNGEDGSLSEATRQSLESTIIERVPYILDEEQGPIHVELLGAQGTSAGTIAAFKVRIEGSGGMGFEERTLVVIAMPSEGGHALLALTVGEINYEPGSEISDTLESFSDLRVEHGLVRAELTIISTSSEHDTCADCNGERRWPTLRHRFALLCVEEESYDHRECSLTTVAVEIVSPGVDIYDGVESPRPERSADVHEFELSLTLVDGETVRLDPVSGTLEPDMASTLGEVHILDLGDPDFSSEVLEEP